MMIFFLGFGLRDDCALIFLCRIFLLCNFSAYRKFNVQQTIHELRISTILGRTNAISPFKNQSVSSNSSTIS